MPNHSFAKDAFKFKDAFKLKDIMAGISIIQVDNWMKRKERNIKSISYDAVLTQTERKEEQYTALFIQEGGLAAAPAFKYLHHHGGLNRMFGKYCDHTSCLRESQEYDNEYGAVVFEATDILDYAVGGYNSRRVGEELHLSKSDGVKNDVPADHQQLDDDGDHHFAKHEGWLGLGGVYIMDGVNGDGGKKMVDWQGRIYSGSGIGSRGDTIVGRDGEGNVDEIGQPGGDLINSKGLNYAVDNTGMEGNLGAFNKCMLLEKLVHVGGVEKEEQNGNFGTKIYADLALLTALFISIVLVIRGAIVDVRFNKGTVPWLAAKKSPTTTLSCRRYVLLLSIGLVCVAGAETIPSSQENEVSCTSFILPIYLIYVVSHPVSFTCMMRRIGMKS